MSVCVGGSKRVINQWYAPLTASLCSGGLHAKGAYVAPVELNSCPATAATPSATPSATAEAAHTHANAATQVAKHLVCQ